MNAKKLPRQEARWPPPAFQLYASDMLASQFFKRASLVERGLLLTMLAEVWVNGTVPADARQLALTLGISAQAVESAMGALVRAHFREAPQGEGEEPQLYSPDLEGQKQHLSERRRKLRAAGQKGGRATQARERNSESGRAGPQAGLEASLKPLSRGEKKREDSFQGGAMNENKGNAVGADDPWLKAYDA